MTAHDNTHWQKRWEERGAAVFRVLGDTMPAKSVTPFSWKERMLPGACALTFGPTTSRRDYLYMTLGLTQPLTPGDRTYPWEFAVRACEKESWPIDLLYQLVTHWLDERGSFGYGHYLPLQFTRDRTSQVWANIAPLDSSADALGDIRGLYLWRDEAGMQFTTSTGPFSLLTVVAVTADEMRLAEETTPAHLMLLFRRLGIEQVCDYKRSTVLSLPSASNEWQKIALLDHDDVLQLLQASTDRR